MSTRFPPRTVTRRLLPALVLSLALLGGTVAVADSSSAATVCGYTVNDIILAKARAVFGPNVCPTGNTAWTPNNQGMYNHFQQGFSVYWKSSQGGTSPQVIYGAIRDKWASLGWENSLLGFPVTDENGTPDGVGRYNHFEGGSIYWSPSSNAHEVHGAIRSKWAQKGWETFLGYPTTDETVTPDGVGRYNHFTGGSIYWKPSVGAHEIHGQIRQSWANQGWEKSWLGYPISDETASPSQPANRFTSFENGVVYWQAAGNTIVANYGPADLLWSGDLNGMVRSVVSTYLTQKGQFCASEAVCDDDGVYFRSDPVQADSTDYSFDGQNVHNRLMVVTVPLAVEETTGDPTVDLKLWIEFGSAGQQLTATVVNADASVHVPAPTSWFNSADSVKARFLGEINPVKGLPLPIRTLTKLPIAVKMGTAHNLGIYYDPA